MDVSFSLYAQIIISFYFSKKVDNFTIERINVNETKKNGYNQEGNTPYLRNQLRPTEETRWSFKRYAGSNLGQAIPHSDSGFS